MTSHEENILVQVVALGTLNNFIDLVAAFVDFVVLIFSVASCFQVISPTISPVSLCGCYKRIFFPLQVSSDLLKPSPPKFNEHTIDLLLNRLVVCHQHCRSIVGISHLHLKTPQLPQSQNLLSFFELNGSTLRTLNLSSRCDSLTVDCARLNDSTLEQITLLAPNIIDLTLNGMRKVLRASVKLGVPILCIG